MIEIFVDGDACPVKDEVYDVASRHSVRVVVVANARMRVPHDLGVEMIVVDEGPDAADDWIAAEVRPHDVVVTADIPLAARCLEAGAAVLGTDGRPFTEDMIGSALATREIKAHIRESGMVTGGPRPQTARDRSRFSNALHQMVEAALRSAGGRA
ncbi:MAG: YaiI/YqxD family protein [Myxococcota bacterium]